MQAADFKSLYGRKLWFQNHSCRPTIISGDLAESKLNSYISSLQGTKKRKLSPDFLPSPLLSILAPYKIIIKATGKLSNHKWVRMCVSSGTFSDWLTFTLLLAGVGTRHTKLFPISVSSCRCNLRMLVRASKNNLLNCLTFGRSPPL